MTENATLAEECISTEIGRAGRGYQLYATVHVLVALPCILSGVFLLHKYQKNVWIARRHPTILLMLVIPMFFNLAIGPLYRIYLNEKNSFLAKCIPTNFLLVVVIVTIIIPNMVRVISYHYRVKLNKGLSRLNALASEGAQYDYNSLNGSATGSIYFLQESSKTVGLTSYLSFMDDRMEKVIDRMKFKASSRFASRLAFSLLVFFIMVSLLFALLTCPVAFLGREDVCTYGFSLPAAILIVLPLFPVVGVFFYYKHLVRQAPDPFKLKEEFNVFAASAIVLLFIFVADMINLGGLRPSSDDTTSTIHFKIVQFSDLVFLGVFVHSIHYQVYLAKKHEKNLKLEIPIGLDEILKHPEASEMFKSYLETEFSVEIFIVYQMLLKWKKRALKRGKEGSSKSDRDAEAIFKRYIENTEDVLSINLSYSLKEELRHNLMNKEGNLEADFFDKVIRTLYGQMEHNGFIRFVNTEDYRVFTGLCEPIRRGRYDSQLE